MEVRLRLLLIPGLVLGATFATPALAPACDSTGCLLLTRGQNGVMAKGTWRVDLSFRDTDQSDSRRGSAPTDLVLRPKIYFEQERVVPAFHLDRHGRERFLQVDVGYGLFERTTVFLSLPAATQRSHDVAHGAVNTTYDVRGVGDGVIGVRQALAKRGALVGGPGREGPPGPARPDRRVRRDDPGADAAAGQRSLERRPLPAVLVRRPHPRRVVDGVRVARAHDRE